MPMKYAQHRVKLATPIRRLSACASPPSPPPPSPSVHAPRTRSPVRAKPASRAMCRLPTCTGFRYMKSCSSGRNGFYLRRSGIANRVGGPVSQSARRTLLLVEHLAEAGPSRLSSIASTLGLNKTTAFRFVSALVEMGWVHQNPATRVYGLSPRVLELGSMVLDRMEIRHEVRPHLERLAELTSETSHLGVLDGLEMVYIDKVEGRQAVSMASRLGARGACHSTTLGKVLLAARPEPEWE